MNQHDGPRRVIWIGVIGGVLLLGILAVSMLSPDSGGGYNPGPQVAVDTPAPSATEVTPSTRPLSFDAGQLVSLAWRLALVIVIIGVSVVALRWWARKTAGPRSGTGFLRVLDTLAVGNGRTIHLVALGNRVIVVGATAQNIAYLNELTADEAIRVRTDADRPADEALSDIAASLVAAFRGGREPVRPRQDVALEQQP